jgi:hypothetical protein
MSVLLTLSRGVTGEEKNEKQEEKEKKNKNK